MDKKQFFFDFIDKRTIGVISTINADGKPEAAVVGIGQTDNLEIIIGTFNTTRKYKNLQQNSSVAFVIGWEEGHTVQYEGTARELGPEDIDTVRDNYWAKNRGAKKYYSDERQRYFIVKPTWIRFTDITKEPRETIELIIEKL